VNRISKLTVVATAIALTACSVLETDKVDYRSTVKTPALDIPPDLTQLSKDTRYTVVDGTVSASGYQAATQAAPVTAATATLSAGDVRIERSGNQRWLVVKRPAEQLWDPVKDFWIDNGFLLAIDQSKLGIMETDWAENRAKIPQDMIRSALGKVLDSLYSTGERDKFRTRLERSGNGDTEIYISHRGMIEVVTSGFTTGSTVWQPRPSDPELEAEFLRRLMVKLGSSPEQAKAMVAATASAKNIATVATDNGQSVLRITEDFDRAWRRVGLALDRTGFTVEDRDRKQGVYFVRYVPLNSDNTKPGFFGKLFSSSDKNTEASKFQIAVRTTGTTSTVSVLNGAGAPETSGTAARIVKVIADDIN
jgi:outer membrane protein assembly factor BamC